MNLPMNLEVFIILIVDGGNGEIFNFELNDKQGNKHFYEIYANNLQVAIKIAQKWFIEAYGNKATHLERDVIGFPITRNI